MASTSAGDVGNNVLPSSVGVTADQVSSYLLDNNFLLTALEFLLENSEAGKETEVGLLSTFFADRTRFPPEALAKFEPADAVDLQKLSQQREEELAVVRYELQVTKEDLAALKAAGDSAKSDGNCAAVAAASVAAIPDLPDADTSEVQLLPEQRMLLNTAVFQYLSQWGYDNAALAFAEELGYELPKANGRCECPALVQYFHAQLKQDKAAEMAKAAEEQLTTFAETQKRLAELEHKLTDVSSERNQLQADCEYLQSKVAALQEQQEAAIEAAVQRLQQQVKAHGDDEPGLQQSASLTNVKSDAASGSLQNGGGSERLANDSSDSAAAMAPAKVSTTSLSDALQIVTRTLPRVVPGTLVAKREELLPLFYLAVCEHPDAGTRASLASQLFTLVRKPTATQCTMIAGAMAEAAVRVGPARAAQELVPPVVSQVSSQHPERRLLVIETCGMLFPLVKPGSGAREECRAAFQQLATDLDPIVKLAAIQQLAACMPNLESLDAYPQVEDLLMRISSDPTPAISDMLHSMLLPAVLKWLTAALPQPVLLPEQLPSSVTHRGPNGSSHIKTHDTQGDLEQEPQAVNGASHGQAQVPSGGDGVDAAVLLYGSLLPRVLEALQGVLLRCPFTPGTDPVLVQKGEAEQRAVSDGVLGQVELYLQLYMQLLPPIRQVACCSMPDWAQQAACAAAAVDQATVSDVDEGMFQGNAHLMLSPSGGSFSSRNGAAEGPSGPSAGARDRHANGVHHPVPETDSRVATQSAAATDARPDGEGGAADHAVDGSISAATPEGQQQEDGATAAVSPGLLSESRLHHEGMQGQRHGVSEPDSAAEAASGAIDSGDGAYPLSCNVAIEGEQSTVQGIVRQESASALGVGDEALQPPPTPEGHDAEHVVRLGQQHEDGFASASAEDGAAASEGGEGSRSDRGSQRAGSNDVVEGDDAAQGESRPATPFSGGGDDERAGALDGSEEATVSGRTLSDSQLHAAFAAWSTHPNHEQWAVVEAIMQIVMPGLLSTCRWLPATAAMGPLRRRLAQVLRSTAAMMGPLFTQGAMEPLFLASSTAPDYRLLHRESDHVAALASALVPLTWEGTRVGRVAVLPILMASVVPCGPPGALRDFLWCLCGLDAGQTDVWALEYPQDFIAAVQFSASCNKGLQQDLLRIMWELVVKENTAARQSAAHMCRALVSVLTAKQVSKHLLPACVTLLGDSDATVCEIAVRCMVELYGAYPTDAAIAARVQEQLETAVPSGQHQVQMTALQTLTDQAPSFGAPQLEFMLKQLQWLVSTLHERSGSNVRGPSQLREMAGAILDALRIIDTCELLDEALRLHHLTGLMALQHDKELLDPVQRDLLAAMLRDRTNEAEEPQQPSPKGPNHRRVGSGGARGDAGPMSNVLAVRNDGSTGRMVPASPKGPPTGPPVGTSIGRMASELMQKRGALNTMASLSHGIRDPRRMASMSSFLEKNLNIHKRDSAQE